MKERTRVRRTLWSVTDLSVCIQCGQDVIQSSVQRAGQPIRPAVYLPEYRAFLCAKCGGVEVRSE